MVVVVVFMEHMQFICEIDKIDWIETLICQLRIILRSRVKIYEVYQVIISE